MITESNRFLLHNRLKRYATAKSTLILAFLWGLAEGTLFFIVPDVYIVFVALFHWQSGLLAMLSSVLGSMVGGALMYALSAKYGVPMAELLVHIPLISPHMVETVAQRMQLNGLLTLVDGPLQGIPYKVYAVQAGRQSLPFLLFLLTTIPARLERLLPVTLVGAASGAVFKRLIRQHTQLVVVAYALLWVAVYVGYYFQMR